MASIKRNCPVCKKEHEAEFDSTPRTNVARMKKADIELEKRIRECTHSKD